eukprot:1155414-Pelagomonas_calceolata.AAC.7
MDALEPARKKEKTFPTLEATFFFILKGLLGAGGDWARGSGEREKKKAATAQHASTRTRLKTRSLRNPDKNNRVSLHIILIGMAGTVYNDYTIDFLIKWVLTRQEVKPLPSKSSCYVVQRLKAVINTRHSLHFQRASGGGQMAADSRRRNMADNPPDLVSSVSGFLLG